MQSKHLVKVTVAALVLLALNATIVPTTLKKADASVGGNGLIVPLYGWDNNYEQVIAAKTQHPNTPIIAIINPSSGPGVNKDAHWTDIVNKLRATGIKVVGYVSTDYASQPLTAVEAQADSYFAWYGVDGIFFDVASPDAYTYYKSLTDHVKSSNGTHITIINPGAAVPQTYVDAADIIIVCENGSIPSGITGNGIDASHLGVLIHDVQDSGTVFYNVHGQAKYVYSAQNWFQAATDIEQQAARMN